MTGLLIGRMRQPRFEPTRALLARGRIRRECIASGRLGVYGSQEADIEKRTERQDGSSMGHVTLACASRGRSTQTQTLHRVAWSHFRWSERRGALHEGDKGVASAPHNAA